MIQVMAAAKQRLEQFYNQKKDGAAFVQAAGTQTPPEALGKYQANGVCFEHKKHFQMNDLFNYLTIF